MFGLVYPPALAPLYPRPSVNHPGIRPVEGEEMLPLVDTSGLVYGRAARSYCHSGSKVLHPVVHLHLIDRMERIYLQKRSMNKDLLPGYWDTAVGGHVTYGETVEEARQRAGDSLCQRRPSGLVPVSPGGQRRPLVDPGRDRRGDGKASAHAQFRTGTAPYPETTACPSVKN